MFERKKTSGKLLSLPIDQIHPSPFQARKSFDEQELTALAQSIRENGLLQPVTVRKVAEGYELVAGERRLRACQLAKMTTIPAILCSYADDRTAALGLLENIQRADLNPFEQAQGLRDVMVLWDCTQAEAAKRLGMAQDMLLVLYSQANSSGLRCTTPFTSIYMISENKTPTVMAAARITHMSTARDPGLFLYVSQNCSQEPFPIFFIGQPSFLMP